MAILAGYLIYTGVYFVAEFNGLNRCSVGRIAIVNDIACAEAYAGHN
jgi:hypothetical protein